MIKRDYEYWEEYTLDGNRVIFNYDKLKLKPCPFCGEKGQMLPQSCVSPIDKNKTLKYFMVRCWRSCGCKVENILTSDARTAQLMWNNRVDESGIMWKEDDYEEQYE